jgi:LPXTG-site transpeptidase (sortase) family protein
VKTRFLLIFLVSFILIFSVLNSRFVIANVKFWALNKTIPPPIASSNPLPIEPNKAEPNKKLILPDKALLVINGIGVSAPIIFGVGSNTKNIYNNLENGVVHYSDTPKPGMNGVSIILGHSSAYPWYKGAYGSVFALLGKLKVGDKIYVKYEDGQTFVFSVKQSIIFSPFAKDNRLSEIEKSEKPTLVLISCWPVGTNYKRIAVQAELE